MNKLSIILATVTIASLLVSSCTAINSLKSQASSVIAPSTSSWVMEQYAVFGQSSYENLYTMQSWSGTNDEVLSFSSNETPMVINFGYTPTSNIASSLDIEYQGGNHSGAIVNATVGGLLWVPIFRNGTIIEGTGAFKIKVTSSGCNWWIKIGVEQGNTPTTTTTSINVAAVISINVSFTQPNYWLIVVTLEPTTLTKPNIRYTLTLYQNGQYRDSVLSSITWSASEITNLQYEYVNFPCTQAEYQQYSGQTNLSNIFSAKVTQ